MLNIGDKIPDFLGTDQNNNPIMASDYVGHDLALYFYPKDNTPGCTAEACNLRDSLPELRARGFEVIGVSKDSIASHQKFAANYELPFPLIADTDLRLNELFGVWKEKKMAGRTYMGTVRTTFLINKEGIITHIIDKVDTKDHAIQILNLTNLHI